MHIEVEFALEVVRTKFPEAVDLISTCGEQRLREELY